MKQLKPCPFCGGSPKIVESEIGVPEDGKKTYQYRHIECRDCGCRGSSFRIVQFRNSGFSYSAKWDVGEMQKMERQWNRRVEIKKPEKEEKKARPAWMPIEGEDGEMVGTFAFCPHCGMVLSQFDIDGKKIGETSCRNCGTEITWEGYPQTPGTDTRKREKPDDI